MPVTMQDVAAVAGVSAKTVSNVISGYSYVRPATKARVEAALHQLGYQMNHSARQLRSGRTGIISLAIPELHQPYFAELAHSVIDEAQQLGLSVVVEITGGLRERELRILGGGQGHLVDGIVFAPLALAQESSDVFPGALPVVMLVERVLGADDATVVTMANLDGAKAAVVHLAEIGCRRIGAIGVQASSLQGPQLRLQGYREGLAVQGLEYDPSLVVATDDWHREAGAAAAARLLDDGVDFDGLFCFNDAVALGVLWELANRGISVPGDVAVIGFDDTEDARFATPTLTSIEPGRPLLARTAVKLLGEQLAGAAPHPQEVIVDFALIPRGSTAR